MGCLISAFPENAMELYSTCDYWACKELLELNNSQKINQEENNQAVENSVFNEYLNQNSYKKFNWVDVDTKMSLWDIQKLCKECLLNHNSGMSE